MDKDLDVGTKVSTFGHPLGYSGPAPILTVGYLAGFSDHREDDTSEVVKRYVVNAAFNGRTSGGPLFVSDENEVVGVVVAKHAPIPEFLRKVIDVLASTDSGFQYSGTDPNGNPVSWSEAQLVAYVLRYFRSMTQVVIGEAIAGSEVLTFFEESGISV